LVVPAVSLLVVLPTRASCAPQSAKIPQLSDGPPRIDDSLEAGSSNPTSGTLHPLGPADLMARALFFVYQRGAAPSKGHKCPMSPSCSEFGRLAVKHFGLLRGSLMAADRLHRCGHDLRYYPTVFDDRGAGSWDPPSPE